MRTLAALLALTLSSCGGPGTPLVAFVLAGCASAPLPRPPPPPPPPPPPCPSCASPVVFGQLFTASVPSLAAIPYAVRAWADNGNLAAKGPSSIPLGLYTAAYRVRGVTVPPECIARKADGSPAYEFGDTTETPIDFTNPVCIALKEGEILAGLHGQTVLSIDNIDVSNSYGIVGPTGHPRYTGGPGDPVWLADNIAWIKTLAAFAHGHGLTAWINDTGGSLNIAPTDWQAVCAQADGCMQEGWPLDACYQDDTWKAGRATGAAFDNEFQELRDAGRPTWTAAYLCSGAPSDAANADNDQWVVASYLLVAKPGDVLSLSTTALSSAPVAYPAAMSPKLGQPLGPATGTRPYVRRFQGGSVYVNPGLNPVTADGHTLPAVSALIVVTP